MENTYDCCSSALWGGGGGGELLVNSLHSFAYEWRNRKKLNRVRLNPPFQQQSLKALYPQGHKPANSRATDSVGNRGGDPRSSAGLALVRSWF